MKEWLVIVQGIGMERFNAYTRGEARAMAKRHFAIKLPLGTLIVCMSPPEVG